MAYAWEMKDIKNTLFCEFEKHTSCWMYFSFSSVDVCVCVRVCVYSETNTEISHLLFIPQITSKARAELGGSQEFHLSLPNTDDRDSSI